MATRAVLGCSKNLSHGFPTSYFFCPATLSPHARIHQCSCLRSLASCSGPFRGSSSSDIQALPQAPEGLQGRPPTATFLASPLTTLLCFSQACHLLFSAAPPPPPPAARLLASPSLSLSTWDALASPNETLFLNKLGRQMATIKKSDDSKCWQGRGERGALACCW